MIRPFGVTVVQTVTRVVTGPADKDEVIRANTARDLEMLKMVFSDSRYRGSKLVLFPEFFLTAVPESRATEEYMVMAMELPGRYTEPFSELAQRHRIYVAGNAFEIDPHWPDRFFNTTWIIGPNGDMILKYRKINTLQLVNATNHTPPDMYDEYVSVFGEDSLFPVVDTEIGRLACLTCQDINYPEVARCLAFQGAEVLLMPTGDGYTFAGVHRLFRQARAIENTMYVVCATHGKFVGGPRPADQQRGYSEIIDFRGQPLITIDGPGEATATAYVDLQALRFARERLDYFNYLPMVRVSLYAREYARAGDRFWPLNGWKGRVIRSNEEARAMKQSIIDGLYASGVWKRPD